MLVSNSQIIHIRSLCFHSSVIFLICLGSQILSVSQDSMNPSVYAQTAKDETKMAPLPGNTSTLHERHNFTTHYIYGCTFYEYRGYYCDPISNEFKSYAVLASSVKVASAT